MTKRVLIVAPNPSTFVIRDVELLTDEFSVGFIRNPAQLRMSSILGMIMMPCAIIRSDIVITWFADYSKLVVRMARLFGKRSIVMIAGYDVAKIDSIGYGALISKRKRKMVEWSLEHANQVIAVDSGLVEDLVTHFGRHFDAVVVHTGYNERTYHPEGVKRDLVLSVCGAVDHRGLVKGIDVFAECARRMPDVSFRIIGVKGGAIDLLGKIPDNLEVIGLIPPDDIVPHYQEAKVYCQLSMREGFPNVVCEAMLCGCTVVGSDVQGVKTVVGDHGFLVPYGDVERTCDAIKIAMSTPDLGGRLWIIDNFSEPIRKMKLTEIISRLLG